MSRNSKWPLLAVMAVSCADVEHADTEHDESFTELASVAAVAPVGCLKEFVAGGAATGGLTKAQFYAWAATDNASLTNLPNGKLVRCQEAIKSDKDTSPYTKYRVLYKTNTRVTNGGVTTDLALISSGQIWVPLTTGKTYSKNQPVLSNTHGAIGVIANTCAPSAGNYTDSLPALHDLSVGSFADAVLTVPDYVGIGVDHQYRVPDANALDSFGHTYLNRVSHPFVSIESEGRSVIDLVRATQEIPTASVGSGSKWLVVGVSQGGHAALATAEVWTREDYNLGGPQLKGAIAGAPASELQNQHLWPDEAKDSIFAMLTAAITLENRDISASSLFNQVAKTAFGATTNVACYNSAQALLTWWGAYSFGGTSIYNQSIDTIFNNPTYKALLTKNSPGNLPVALKVPVFIGSLRGDPLVREERVRAAVALYQSKPATDVTYCYYAPVVTGTGAIANAANHDAYRRMFPQKDANGNWVDKPQLPACTGSTTGTAVISPVEWAAKL